MLKLKTYGVFLCSNAAVCTVRTKTEPTALPTPPMPFQANRFACAGFSEARETTNGVIKLPEIVTSRSLGDMRGENKTELQNDLL